MRENRGTVYGRESDELPLSPEAAFANARNFLSPGCELFCLIFRSSTVVDGHLT